MVREVKTNEFRDSDHQLLDQNMSTFEIGCIEPPRFDCRNAFQKTAMKRQQHFVDKKTIKKNLMKRNAGAAMSSDSIHTGSVSESTSLLETDPEEIEIAPEDNWMIVGFHRGMVVIYNIHKFDIPQCRYDVCRAEIIMIREVYQHKLHLFYDASNMLTLAQFTDKGVKIMHQINVFRPLFDIFVYKT